MKLKKGRKYLFLLIIAAIANTHAAKPSNRLHELKNTLIFNTSAMLCLAVDQMPRKILVLRNVSPAAFQPHGMQHLTNVRTVIAVLIQ